MKMHTQEGERGLYSSGPPRNYVNVTVIISAIIFLPHLISFLGIKVNFSWQRINHCCWVFRQKVLDSSFFFTFQVKFTSAVKLSEGSAIEYGREEEENFFKRLGKWRSGRRNPSKLHHTEEKDGRILGCLPPPPSTIRCLFVCVPVLDVSCASGTLLYHLPYQLSVCLSIFVRAIRWKRDCGSLTYDLAPWPVTALSELSWTFSSSS